MASTPDFQSQLEAILHAVWEAEKNWDFDDRLDLAAGILPRQRSGPVVVPVRFPWYPGPPKGGLQ